MLAPTVEQSLLNAKELRKSALGNYIIVTLDIDTTGRRLSDEVCT